MSLALSRRVLARRSPVTATVVVASALLAILVAAALAPSLFTPLDPLRADAGASLLPPSPEHPFGTDQSGRDVFARVVYGAQYSLGVGLGASALALMAGLLVGVSAGLAPKVVDSILARVIAIAMSFPEFLLALIVIAIIGPGQGSLVAAIAIATAPVYARVARSQTLVVRNSGYVRAATTLGVAPPVTVLRHVVPNTLGPLLVMATIGVGSAIVSAAGLSYLGLGPAAPAPEWGVILADGRNFLGSAWWITVFPGVVITLTVISVSVLGRFVHSRTGGAR
ncbi:peptide/nickel transport system permease protein [Microbacteriaceae bacterium SG_E_30_P1]|uniref:Peptide/nickel transport system permease protein n=1 Tax=Antiquaquibacter oligotrophicus TaxID=2880260 RepID=A0ABT6KPY5_9MICO|nr:ABC transporter permease [Antiquaquibacter oligotrophicus]MDH6181232.1 peptide/nickel transport system permease protein [Antiquaquibacter oligotrophicus]UDF13073.1 ABC transporter permease [Antiquaquibacter oligotrophicus]